MKKNLLLLFFAVSVFATSRAQYVTIPDANFAAWLTNYYPTCISGGNQLDTTCAAIRTATIVNCGGRGIADLTGIQYFDTLVHLDCSTNSLTSLPAMPASLLYLNCRHNQITALPLLPNTLQSLLCDYNQLTAVQIPDSLYSLNCSVNQITALPSLSANLNVLECDNNPLTALPALSPVLVTLSCARTNVGAIPALPATLAYLECSTAKITDLPVLPAGLQDLFCGGNSISVLPSLPTGLLQLSCGGTLVATIPPLPATLKDLFCGSSYLTALPALPAGLQGLFCVSAPHISLPSPLPTTLQVLQCNEDSLTSLPALPAGLRRLLCNMNLLNTLPALPNSITYLLCDRNLLTSIPTLPDSLSDFMCYANPFLACLPTLKRVVNLNFSNTAIACLPNYGTVTNSTPPLSSIPLCDTFNTNNCQIEWSIAGNVYYDANNNCVNNATDFEEGYIKLQLYQGGVLQQQVFTGSEGYYSFKTPAFGTYTTLMDTSQLPLTVACPDSTYYTNVISAADSVDYGKDFGLKCRTQGFDVGVWTIVNDYHIPRPAAVITVHNVIGDISQVYGAHCAAGISGKVKATYSGPMKYLGPAPGALTPTINGNSLTWNIADYGTAIDSSDFNIMFRIDTFATPGSLICIAFSVTPTAGDYNPGNNTPTYCAMVANSLDPNRKEVSPVADIDTSEHWLTYTIRFQNTGTAPALNIYLMDTLNSNLDVSTFQLLAYSHKVFTQILPGGIARFNFANINLPDSTSDEPNSHGYVQYKIKLKDNLPIGTTITNTAYIYFDFNSPVVTNTTLNTITTSTGIAPIAGGELPMTLYPNPAQNSVLISTDETAVGGHLTLTDVSGREVMSLVVTNQLQQLSTAQFARGIYFVKLNDAQGRSGVKKLVLE